jgi:hypothetical protein
MLVTFSTCKDLIRTLPALQHDALKPEDVDSDMEDHAPDEARYACMSRPWIRKKAADDKPKNVSGYKTAATCQKTIGRQASDGSSSNILRSAEQSRLRLGQRQAG